MSIFELEGAAIDKPTDFQSQSRFIVAIDFGTTFTGVAYYYTGRDAHKEPHQIVQKISVIKSWPKTGHQYNEKTPTVISYGSTPPAWGGRVRPTDREAKRLFKLGLEPRIAVHYQRSTRSEYWPRWRQRPSEPVDITTDYLGCIYKYVHEVALFHQYGNEFLQKQRMQYVITVPAIWSNHAKALTRQAAVMAGFPDDELSLIAEPEAAALYCASIYENFDLERGDMFMICDAGGGTVVYNHL